MVTAIGRIDQDIDCLEHLLVQTSLSVSWPVGRLDSASLLVVSHMVRLVDLAGCAAVVIVVLDEARDVVQLSALLPLVDARLVRHVTIDHGRLFVHLGAGATSLSTAAHVGHGALGLLGNRPILVAVVRHLARVRFLGRWQQVLLYLYLLRKLCLFFAALITPRGAVART